MLSYVYLGPWAVSLTKLKAAHLRAPLGCFVSLSNLRPHLVFSGPGPTSAFL
jgi:hypothetical protein